MVLAGQVDSGARRIARYLSQAARRRLKDEVVRTAKPARKGAGEQARTVPSLSALVHEQDHAMRRSRVVQSVERFDIVGLGEARIRRVDERQSRAEARAYEGGIDGWPQLLQVVRLREVDGQFRRRAVGQGHVPIVAEEILDDVCHEVAGIVVKLQRLDVPRNIFEDAVTNALRQAVLDDDIAERLFLEVRRTGGVDHTEHVCARCKVIDCFSDLLQPGVERLAVRVVRLIREDRQMGQAGDRLQPQVG